MPGSWSFDSCSVSLWRRLPISLGSRAATPRSCSTALFARPRSWCRPMTDERAEPFSRYVEVLIEGERPSPDDVAEDEALMARLAAEMAAAGLPEDPSPDPAF